MENVQMVYFLYLIRTINLWIFIVIISSFLHPPSQVKKKYFYLPDTNSDGLKCRLFTTDFQAVKDAVPTLICIF